jgi:apolipoprotein N-acyltransferase
MGGAHLTFNVEILAWFCAVPFLLYLHWTKGIPSRIYFILAMILSWSFAVFKIITDPIPYLMIPLYSVPIALMQVPGYLIWSGMRGRPYSYFLFPSIMVVMEWIQYTLTPLGSWGAAAYAMVDQIILLQFGSVFGLAGISFILYLINVVVAEWIMDPSGARTKLVPVGFVLTAVMIYGSLRIDYYNSRSKTQIKVAAVGTDSRVGGLPLPVAEIRESNKDKLIERTENAASSGAELIVWNEASTVILPDEEDAWKKRLSSVSGNNQITLISSYIVLLSKQPFRYENKYVMYLPDGTEAYTYHKHQPVPGEPAKKGIEPIETISLAGIEIGGAICYDYDFPKLAQSYGQLGADIVGLPSSDWRGIDPIHTKMAAMRAIEQGHSILRSTRFGLSAAINPIGTTEAQMSSFNQNDQIMIAHLPKTKVFTLYALIGDLFIYTCMVLIGIYLCWILGSRFKNSIILAFQIFM